jgi:hypothetical protein
MKKLIFLFILLFCSAAYAGSLMMVGGGVPVAAGGSENIGNTNNESSDMGIYSSVCPYCTKLENTPGHNGTVSSMVLRLYCDGSGNSCTIRANIYTDNAGAPNTPVTNAGTDEIVFSNTSFADITYNYTGTKPALTASTQYWICIWAATGYAPHAANKASGTTVYTSGNTYPSWPSPYSTPSTSTATFGKAYLVNDY